MAFAEDTRIVIGDVGEQVIQEFLNSNMSTDRFDAQQDGFFNNLNYQVKTFRLNKKTNGFWLGNNKSGTMWDNIDKVKMLFFVKVPESTNELATFYLCIDHAKCWKYEFTNNNVRVRNYPFTNCIKLGIMDSERSRVLFENSIKISTFKRTGND